MELYPAIDLKDGACVRLLRGAMDQATTFNDSPPDQALRFQTAGAQHLHLVDLNGAISGKPVNDRAVRDILAAVTLPVQLGGGIRDAASAAHWLDLGIARIILGTVALTEPRLVSDLARAYPGRIVVGIDAREGRVAVSGWTEQSDVTADALAKRFEDAGVAGIVYTDINRDGAMAGPNIDATAELASAISIPVIASGGVHALSDLSALKAHAHCGIEGVIVGRALYERAFTISEARKLLEDADREGADPC